MAAGAATARKLWLLLGGAAPPPQPLPAVSLLDAERLLQKVEETALLEALPAPVQLPAPSGLPLRPASPGAAKRRCWPAEASPVASIFAGCDTPRGPRSKRLARSAASQIASSTSSVKNAPPS